jgi:uncharacterized membrane protein YfcA
MSRKNLFKIIVVTGIVLFIPFIAMLITDEVRWNTFDFVLMDLMIFSSVLLGVTFQKKIKNPKKRILVMIILLLLFLLIWAELAVGIFDTLFAGS